MIELQDLNEELQRPTLAPQQQWIRNQFYKNWGKFNPTNFLNGQPTFIFPSYLNLSLIVLSILFLLFISQLDYIVILMSAVASGIYLYSCHLNPGVQSNGLPILNQIQYKRFKKFCEPCRIFKNLGIVHCQKCRVCLKGVFYHSSVLGVCLTERNYWVYCGFYCLVNFIIFRLIFIKFFADME